MGRTDPTGKEFGPDDYVFGDEVGRKVKDTKKPRETAVLRSHGYTPQWTGHGLSPESRAQLRLVGLHYHDLRHEGSSRLAEEGWPVHHVSYVLGHSNLEQTTTYLNATFNGLDENMRRSDEVRARCKPVANEGGIEHRLVSNDNVTSGARSLIN